MEHAPHEDASNTEPSAWGEPLVREHAPGLAVDAHVEGSGDYLQCRVELVVTNWEISVRMNSSGHTPPVVGISNEVIVQIIGMTLKCCGNRGDTVSLLIGKEKIFGVLVHADDIGMDWVQECVACGVIQSIGIGLA